MITLIVEPYCHRCPDFEPKVDKNIMEYYTDNLATMERHRYSFANTEIRCEHCDRCHTIKEYLALERSKENDGST